MSYKQSIDIDTLPANPAPHLPFTTPGAVETHTHEMHQSAMETVKRLFPGPTPQVKK